VVPDTDDDLLLAIIDQELDDQRAGLRTTAEAIEALDMARKILADYTWRDWNPYASGLAYEQRQAFLGQDPFGGQANWTGPRW
jgi:hypothetical protein